MSDDNGIDRYEAQSIAENAARNAANDAERNVGFEIQRLHDEIRSLRIELEHERDNRRAEDTELRESLAELWRVSAKVEVAA